MNARDPNKFNRRASEKIWKDASNNLEEHIMHLNPAYIDRLAPNNDFKPPTKKKYEFDSLIEDLTKETKLKSRGEILDVFEFRPQRTFQLHRAIGARL